MLQVGGDYVYSKGDDHKCPSVALMFQVGASATYHNMGGCKESPNTCNSTNCRGTKFNIMHFFIGNSIPGRLYQGNSINGERMCNSLLVNRASFRLRSGTQPEEARGTGRGIIR